MFTRHWGSEGYKCNSINRVLQEDEAAEMAGNISDQGGTGTNHGNGDDEGNVAPIDSWDKDRDDEFIVACEFLWQSYFLKLQIMNEL